MWDCVVLIIIIRYDVHLLSFKWIVVIIVFKYHLPLARFGISCRHENN